MNTLHKMPICYKKAHLTFTGGRSGDKWTSRNALKPLPRQNVSPSYKTTGANNNFLEVIIFSYRPVLICIFTLPFELQFSQMPQIMTGNFLTTYSIRNFTLENIKTWHLLIKLTCEEIWRQLRDVMKWDMTSYHLIWHLIKH